MKVRVNRSDFVSVSLISSVGVCTSLREKLCSRESVGVSTWVGESKIVHDAVALSVEESVFEGGECVSVSNIDCVSFLLNVLVAEGDCRADGVSVPVAVSASIESDNVLDSV